MVSSTPIKPSSGAPAGDSDLSMADILSMLGPGLTFLNRQLTRSPVVNDVQSGVALLGRAIVVDAKVWTLGFGEAVTLTLATAGAVYDTALAVRFAGRAARRAMRPA